MYASYVAYIRFKYLYSGNQFPCLSFAGLNIATKPKYDSDGLN